MSSKLDCMTILINENAALKSDSQSMAHDGHTATGTSESVHEELRSELMSTKKKLRASEAQLNEQLNTTKNSMTALALADKQLAAVTQELKSAKEILALLKFRESNKGKEYINLKEAARQSELKYMALTNVTKEIHGDPTAIIIKLCEGVTRLEATNTKLQEDLKTAKLSQKKSVYTIAELQKEINDHSPLVAIGTAVSVREFNQSQRKMSGDILLKGPDPDHEATKAGNDAAHRCNGLAIKQLFQTGKLSTDIHRLTFHFLYDSTPEEFGTRALDAYEEIIEVQNMRASIKSQGQLDQIQVMHNYHFESFCVVVDAIAREGLGLMEFSLHGQVRENMAKMRIQMDSICKTQWFKRYSA